MADSVTTAVGSAELAAHVDRIVSETPVFDIHTHQYPPSFKTLFSAGIDDLLTYHYLIAELFRSSQVSIEAFWAMSKPQQADLIWDTLFVRNTPISEACRGVVCVMHAYGLEPRASSLKEAREFFRDMGGNAHLEKAMKFARVSDIVMTNDVFDDREAEYWEQNAPRHPALHAALRLDALLRDWERAQEVLTARAHIAGSGIEPAALGDEDIAGIRSFLDEWIERMKPVYMAVSLPPEFVYPDESIEGLLLRDAVLPTAREHNLPFAMMIGARRRVNPALRDAGDAVGYADITSVERICLENPDNRFLVTMLSRENQHELCVAARKFANLMPFGCWWFLNNPSIVRDITDERVEMLGATCIPQHSDARVLDQIIYKWKHARHTISAALTNAYEALARDGRLVTPDEIQRDVNRLFQDNFRNFAPVRT